MFYTLQLKKIRIDFIFFRVVLLIVDKDAVGVRMLRPPSAVDSQRASLALGKRSLPLTQSIIDIRANN